MKYFVREACLYFTLDDKKDYIDIEINNSPVRLFGNRYRFQQEERSILQINPSPDNIIVSSEVKKIHYNGSS